MFFKKNDKVKDNRKQFELTNDEFEELVFYARERKIRQLEVEFWTTLGITLKQRVMQRLAINAQKVSVDWESVFDTGKIFVMPLPQPIKEKEKKDGTPV